MPVQTILTHRIVKHLILPILLCPGNYSSIDMIQKDWGVHVWNSCRHLGNDTLGGLSEKYCLWFVQGEQHPEPKFSMFCELPQNHRTLSWNITCTSQSKLSEKIKNGIIILVYRPRGSWVINQNSILLVLIDKSRTLGLLKHDFINAMFSNFSTICFKITFSRGHSHMSVDTKCLSIDPLLLRRSYIQWPLHSVHTQWPPFSTFVLNFTHKLQIFARLAHILRNRTILRQF